MLDHAVTLFTCFLLVNDHRFSNRSAAHQTKKQWREAINDAESCVKLCGTFAKGYLHLGRSQLQLKRWDDALSTVQSALGALVGANLTAVQVNSF
jgi:tetratricopeptide (TPR) repeat protein